jgi:hypothetical protein
VIILVVCLRHNFLFLCTARTAGAWRSFPLIILLFLLLLLSSLFCCFSLIIVSESEHRLLCIYSCKYNKGSRVRVECGHVFSWDCIVCSLIKLLGALLSVVYIWW